MKKQNKILFFILILILVQPPRSNGFKFEKLAKAFDFAGFITDAIGHAFNIKELIQNEESVPKIDYERIISEVNSHISYEVKKLYNAVTLDHFLGKIGEEKSCVRNGMQALLFLLKSSPIERNVYVAELTKEAPFAIRCARNMLDLLGNTVLGEENKGLNLVTETYRCDRSVLLEFKQLIYNAGYNGLVLELTYKNLLYKNASLQMEVEFWNNSLSTMKDIFEAQLEACDKKFSKLMDEDIGAISNATELHQGNKKRYSHLWNDVFIFNSSITWFGDLNETTGLFAKNVNSSVTMVMYGESGTSLFQTDRDGTLKTMTRTLEGSSNSNFCNQYSDNFCQSNFSIILCLTYGTDKVQTAFDEDSPALRITLETDTAYLLVQDMEYVNEGCTDHTLLEKSIEVTPDSPSNADSIRNTPTFCLTAISIGMLLYTFLPAFNVLASMLGRMTPF